ncbi:MAG: type I-A CRISPR-associated protein Cas7/Csa2 [Thermoplasmata archaeon]|nr:MAG: type I-A CRISPR-associated protein Cas7/Csa2 [Thermoplasmata archaeon]
MFVSVGVRFEANVEALNMVETAGNYSKHRRVPYIIEEEGKLKTVYVPALSGESLAHAYQELLVKEAKEARIPVCEDCSRAEFFKSMDKQHLGTKVPDIKKGIKPHEIEHGILKRCAVEDIGGFLYAENPPVKRTSAFQMCYALPIKSMALYATTEPQLHARHAQLGEGEKGGVSEQMIYYVEAGTALYGFSFNLDLDAIGRSNITDEILLSMDEVKMRKMISLKALFRLISSHQFGAKLSRFFPVGGIVSTLATVTEHPFSVTSPIYDDYAEKTRKRLEAIKKAFGEPYLYKVTDETTVPEEVLHEMIEYVKEKEHL